MSAAITIEDVLARLDGVQGGGQGQWTARCPHHPDRNNSLAVTIGANGKPLFNCFAGCDYRDIRHDLGLDVPGAFTPTPKSDHKADAGRAPNGDELRLLNEYLAAANHQLAGDTPIAGEALAYVERRFGLSADEAVSIGLGVDGGSSVTSRPKFLANYGGKGAHLVVPMCDPAGRAVSCQARALADASEQRWLSPISTVRGEDEKVNWTRFGFFAMGSPDPVMVCEGLSDPLTAVGAGYSAVGIRGATLARGHALVDELATALAGRRVVLAGDVDAAGKDFTKRLGEGLVAAGLEVRTLEIPVEHGDLTGWHEAVGHESFLSDLERAVSEAAEVLPRPEQQAGERPALRLVAGGEGDPPPPMGNGTGGGGGEREWVPPKIENTDTGNARRMVRRHGTELRHCLKWGKWFIWDGRRWKEDETGEIYRRAKDTVGALYGEARELEDVAKRGELVKHALKSESQRALEAMVKNCQSERPIPVTPDELDRDPWLFNVKNGTLDLRTGDLREHRQADRITKLAPVEYYPEAEAPLWTAFLRRAMADNDELVAWLQRAVGYSLTGQVNEQVLFFLQGGGDNGKSTFTKTLLALFGDYGKPTEPNLLVERKMGEAHPAGVADLVGTRFALTVEVGAGRNMDEALVKQLTGGDRIKARFMRENFFEFTPSHKLWLAANHRPNILGTDHAIWRRIRLVPFNVTIPADEQIKDLDEKLLGELSGILRWAVEGAMAWRQHGLGLVDEVAAATKDYRDEMDTLAQYLDDELIVDAQGWISAKDLYDDYQRWCHEQGEKPESQRALGLRLRGHGFTSAKGGKNNRVRWYGLRSRTLADLKTPTGLSDTRARAEEVMPETASKVRQGPRDDEWTEEF